MQPPKTTTTAPHLLKIQSQIKKRKGFNKAPAATRRKTLLQKVETSCDCELKKLKCPLNLNRIRAVMVGNGSVKTVIHFIIIIIINEKQMEKKSFAGRVKGKEREN